MFEQLSYLKFQTLMKYLISSIVVIALLVLYADAEGIDTIVPDTSLWGLSRNDFKGLKPYDYSETQIGKSKCLFRSKLNIEGYIMDVYYIFGEKMWNSDGWTYKGLSKIVYLLSGKEKHETTELNECRDSLINIVKDEIGEPDSVKKAATVWEKPRYKVEIGKGKFTKYKETDNVTVAVIVTAKDIPKPETAAPTPKSTPKPVPTPKSAIKDSWEEKWQVKKVNSDWLDRFGYSSSDWFSNDYNRCQVVAFMIASMSAFAEDTIDEYSLLTTPCFVGKNEFKLFVLGAYNDTIIIMMYTPLSKTFEYIICEHLFPVMYETAVNAFGERCKDGFYMVDREMLFGCYEKLLMLANMVG